MTPAEKLVGKWRAEAEVLRERYSNEALAKLCEVYAQELEAALRQGSEQSATLDEAAEISGYSKSHLRRMMDDGELTNIGGQGRPRVLVGELPFKAKRVAGEHAIQAAKNSRRARLGADVRVPGFRVIEGGRTS